MDRNIQVSRLDRQAVEDQEVEIVERKGIGHPDSICDGVAESVSRALSQLYLDRVGKVLHYNTDETQLVAGRAAPAFGGGEVVEPVYILIVGRATKEYDGEQLPVDSTALAAARDYLAEAIPELEYGTDVVVDVKLGEGSGDLQDVFGEETQEVPMANDTSFGVGHAPLTETETIVREAERALNTTYHDDHPELGPDVKIMGKREGDRIDITVAAAMVDAYVDGLDEYDDAVASVREYVDDLAREYTDREVNVDVNTADDYDEGSVYLTVTGTSAEQGDDGSVGRGNRANGLITPNRPMSMEATSGKNPVNHIGKIYNLLSTRVAESVTEEVDGIRDLQVRLLSQIGRPIDEPHVADAQIVTEDGVTLSDIEADVVDIVDRELADVTDVTRSVIEGDVSTF
ncbi:methionine adenosyltransferase [Halorubrum ezzemoulense]|uniref:S-adenosylmethionine synthase n=3 Tax=Halorubrum ezzemoulense TaxID=337243 RepID=A0A256JRI3_HALEZ|nr:MULTISPECIES: methionine adenosyltransferase [Halorubrum]MDB2224782.1 methionine adenosyltransferase [Halorubrum ezzemoulense]MDB2237342.1 methionine adenosyltransferase [Halorubrum ezzemoulense]MDB2241820.1 methionine adenosyltransferase [Halorubrum ezzemoulense]MDB2245361.1 methionine adenosyltransferase [Halorubrum ezzemoulense]MDB2246708.1 methionine adenosyltransferase [Halorubrum ezzemoulense]